jgi:hypothetical protein
LLLFLPLAATTSAQQAAHAALDPNQATKLAELMCRQLPNVATIVATIEIQDANIAPATEPPVPVAVTDDVYDALLRLGMYSVPCLVGRLTDARWMPDPRSEPLLGSPVVGDVAYMILGDKGVGDVLPDLANKKPDEMRMDEYFLWPSVGDHRRQLQTAVRAWLLGHPNCCGAAPIVPKAAPSGAKFRMSASELGRARTQFCQLRPGMSPAQVLDIAGKPDAIDSRGENPDETSLANSQRLGLLGLCTGNHNENLAYIYFIERWTDEVALRDPLRDRYVILFFSAEGKFTRMFSNVADICPIFPPTEAVWERVMWGVPIKKE